MTFLLDISYLLLPSPRKSAENFPSFIVPVFWGRPLKRNVVRIGGFNNPQTALGFKNMMLALLMACSRNLSSEFNLFLSSYSPSNRATLETKHSSLRKNYVVT